MRLTNISLPRCVLNIDVREYEWCGFSDASEMAYSAVLYIRCVHEDGSISVNLVAVKTEVAPMKQQSIPKLELCGALLLVRLISAVSTATDLKCPIHAWTDSSAVLRWLSTGSRWWVTFVANRVAEIQKGISSESWRFVPGIENPADCASRGISVDELLEKKEWWHGPAWLT